ncbi:MAG: hypothetical protein ACKERG_03050 [Candidatus Hodgkinia cicadicola]
MQAGLSLIFKMPQLLKLRLVEHTCVVVLAGTAGENLLPRGVFVKNGCVVVCDIELRRVCSELANVAKGVEWMHSKWLVLRGAGYKAMLAGSCLDLKLGLSHSVSVVQPFGVNVSVYSGIKLRLVSVSLHKVTLAAKCIKMLRRPDVYKARGILYRSEHVSIKVGKRK